EDWNEITDLVELKTLDGIHCQDDFADDFDRDASYNDAIFSGSMKFEFENDKLWTITDYISLRELNQEELNDLLKYTTGQWSDGIGEGFEQFPCGYDEDNEEIFISPWSRTQVATIKQELINN